MSDFNWGSDDSTTYTPPKPGKEKKPGQALTFVIAGVIALVLGFAGGFAGSMLAPSGSKTTNTSVAKGGDLYSQPADIEALVSQVREATVTVYCGTWSGSGWGINLLDDPNTTKDDAYPYEIVTNFHVIEDCIDGSPITFTTSGSTATHDAVLFSYDDSAYTAGQKGDLAIIMTATPLKHLAVAEVAPKIGDWVMAVGSPGSGLLNTTIDGNTTFGRVSNYIKDGSLVVSDAAINHGNSGGPLVNSAGEVIGTNTWKEVDNGASGISYSIGIPTICEKLVDCGKDSGLLWTK